MPERKINMLYNSLENMLTIECIPGGASAQVAKLSTGAMSFLSSVVADRRHSSCAVKPTTRIRSPVDFCQYFYFNFCFPKSKNKLNSR